MSVSKERLQKLAKGGYQVAFKSKSNAERYNALLHKHGYKSTYLRSSGQTIEGSYAKKSYYIIPQKMKKRIVKRRPRRRTIRRGGFGMGFPQFRF